MTIYQPTLNYYVYAYLREDETPYYIGKGSGKRKGNRNHTVALPKNRKRIIIIESNLTEVGAYAIERRLIRWYGRKDNGTGILRNLTDGGEGGTGAKRSEKTKRKISKKLTGRSFSDEHRENIGKSSKNRVPWNKNKKGVQVPWNKDKPWSEEVKKKIGKANSNPGEETRKKISEANKNKTPWNKGKKGLHKDTEETKQRKSESRRNKKRGPYKGRTKYSKSYEQKMRKKERIENENKCENIEQSNKIGYNKPRISTSQNGSGSC